MNDSKETVLEKPKRLSTGLFKWGLVFASLSIPVFIPQVHADTIIMRNNALAAKQITGKIVDAKGEPVIGANVVEKGTTNGTITDIDGNFSLDVSDQGNRTKIIPVHIFLCLNQSSFI